MIHLLTIRVLDPESSLLGPSQIWKSDAFLKDASFHKNSALSPKEVQNEEGRASSLPQLTACYVSVKSIRSKSYILTAFSGSIDLRFRVSCCFPQGILWLAVHLFLPISRSMIESHQSCARSDSLLVHRLNQTAKTATNIAKPAR